MAGKENLSDLKMIENLDASRTKSIEECGQTTRTFVAIYVNTTPSLNKSKPDSYGFTKNQNKTVVPEG